jgi:hypothetical protein
VPGEIPLSDIEDQTKSEQRRECMTAKVEVFDPSMCCSTGICGPSVDPVLPRFAADLDWVAEQGIEVTRHNLAQEPAAFAAAPAVQAALTEHGIECLPLILIDGRIVSQGAYPTRAELASWAGLDGKPKAMLEVADKYPGVPTPRSNSAEAPKSSCCGPSPVTDTSTASEPTPAKFGCCG